MDENIDQSYELVTKPQNLLHQSLAFHPLEIDTNLRDLPNHPVTGGLPWSNYSKNFTLLRDERFNSFKMANHYLDLTGDIDVISDAENIKKLLKMPYSKSNVSLMVHRIGNTLMLDDFDIHRHLLMQEKQEWKWLHKFFCETILSGQMQLERRNRTRDHLQERNMLSRFLYHSSLQNAEKFNDTDISLQQMQCQNKQDDFHASIEQDKTMIWNFEDIRMLIGTDLPIFGGGSHPCVSLKLRDMKKKINVLTGLDYWLDNLMCNVPELAMCYHDDGIVKNYELIKTEDIPNIPSCKFLPNVVKDVAQNILSFLKANATKEGHTYWLLKGNGDDIVKLYDLTTLCSSEGEEVVTNPFSTPVGFLLYRVARNMRLLSDRQLKLNTLVKLFQDCLLLLDPQKHVKVVSSAHYHLADLYISDDLNSDQCQSESESEYDEKESTNQVGYQDLEVKNNETTNAVNSVDVHSLCSHNNKTQATTTSSKSSYNKPQPITESMLERCEIAVQHIVQGISSLHQSMLLEQSKMRDRIFEEQAQCDPSTAIPMQYKKEDLLDRHIEEMSMNLSTKSLIQIELALDKQPDDRDKMCWNKSRTRLLRLLLLKKAIVVRGRMVEIYRDNGHYGTALSILSKFFKYYEILEAISDGDKAIGEPCQALLHELAGDLFLHLALNLANIDVYKSEFKKEKSTDDKILALFDCDLYSENQFLNFFASRKDENLLKSLHFYNKAKSASIGKKLNDIRIEGMIANAQNELGSYYRLEIGEVLQQNDEEKLYEIISKSRQAYMKSLESFTKLEDVLNIHLVNSNLTQLLLIEAQILRSKNPSAEVTSHERDFYKKAQCSFESILRQLSSEKKFINLSDSINSDLAKISFRIGELMQDHPPSYLSDFEIENEIIFNFKKALSCYEKILDASRYLNINQSRAFICHRLATLFHKAYRNGSDEKRRKLFKEDAGMYYIEAYRCLVNIKNPCELIALQLARITFCQDILANQTSRFVIQKTLNLSLDYLLECKPAIKELINELGTTKVFGEEDTKGRDSEEDERINKDTHKLMGMLVGRLSSILIQLLKYAAEDEKVLLKSLYAIALKLIKYEQEYNKHQTTKNTNNLLDFCKQTFESFESIQIQRKGSK